LANDLVVSSSAFADGQPIPASYSCKGDNTNPPLTITGVPTETKSLALIVSDPDAPSGNFIHWLVWDIPATTGTINAHSVPVGAIQGKNDAGNNQYFGPCPPSGTHRYIFKVYALDTTLGLDSKATSKELLPAIKDHIIAEAELTGLFSA
jgi:Raf kinase inhibitor-like YbhB/YbcL family protein